MKKLILSFAFVFTIAFSAFSQQDAMYSMYMFNGLLLNPAYAGSREALSFTALYRHQWAGIDGAPKTVTLSGHSPFLNNKIAIGGTLMNDRIGVSNMLQFTGDYAYRVGIGKGKLSLGLRTSVMQYRSRWSELVVNDIQDHAFTNDAISLWLPNFGFGAYYYSDRFYVGAAVPHLLNNSLNEKLELEGTSKVARQWRHYFFTAGYVANLGENLKMKPSVLFKYVNQTPFQADINLSFLIKDALWLGASYRTKDAAVFMIEYLFAKQFRAGYAYDLTLTQLNRYTSGSHEIMLGWDMQKRKDKYLTPRRINYF